MQGTLAPPPAYGSERGSILLQTGVPRTPVDRSRNEGIREEAPLISLEHTTHMPSHLPPEYSSLPRQTVLAQRLSQENSNPSESTSDNTDRNHTSNENDQPSSPSSS